MNGPVRLGSTLIKTKTEPLMPCYPNGWLDLVLDLEKQISELTTDLDKANHEIQLRERQMRKHESKVEDEIEK